MNTNVSTFVGRVCVVGAGRAITIANCVMNRAEGENRGTNRWKNDVKIPCKKPLKIRRKFEPLRAVVYKS